MIITKHNYVLYKHIVEKITTKATAEKKQFCFWRKNSNDASPAILM
jgi:hypothetical protein